LPVGIGGLAVALGLARRNQPTIGGDVDVGSRIGQFSV
jgi:hypothetical protein